MANSFRMIFNWRTGISLATLIISIIAVPQIYRYFIVTMAVAKREAAIEESAAEIQRAQGLAEANNIVGDSLRGRDEYLRYLFIQTLKDGTSERIYIPTEAGLPILEAGSGLRRPAN